jgi:hypothetical protein
VRIADGQPEIAAVLAEPEPAVTLPSVWRLAAVPFAFGAGFRVLLVFCVQVLHGNFLFLDDQGYDRIGWLLAQDWHMHTYPNPGAVGYAGTLSYLYYLFVAAVYFLLGRHWILVKLLTALLSALSVPAAAAIGDSLGGRRLGVAAAWLTALYPNAVFWGATGLKDGPLATLLLAMAAIALRPLTMRRLAGMTVLIVMAFLARPVEGVVCVAMAVLPTIRLWRGRGPGQGHPVRTGSGVLVMLVGVPALAMASFFLAARYLPILKAGMADGAPLSPGTAAVTISYAPSSHDFLQALLGPYPWAFGPGTDTVYRALYPGMVVWIVMLPAVALGCWEILRRGPWAARGIIASALAYLYLYTAVFQSQGFFRQRYTVEILLLVAGVYAFVRFPQRATVWTAIGACVIAPAALVEAGVLPPLGFALVLIALGALLFVQESGTVARVRRATRKRGPVNTSSSGSGQPDLRAALSRGTAPIRAEAPGVHE